MATYYARNVTGNWDSNTSWDSASSSGAGPAGPPIAGDTAIFDSGFTGHIDVAANAACTTLTCQAGATGTLDLSSTTLRTLTVSGDFTLVAGFNLIGSGSIVINAASTITTGGVSIPADLKLASATYTLGDALTVGGALNTYNVSSTFAGAYNITCAYLYGYNGTLTIVSGQTITVQTGMRLGIALGSGGTIKSSTASSAAFLNYAGLASDCKIFNYVFTDIDASGSAQIIDNWYGGTLTRCTNINNMTSANLARAADASKILTGQTVGSVAGSLSPDYPDVGNVTEDDTVNGVTGTYHEATVAEVQDGVMFGAGSALEGEYTGGGGGAINLDKMGAM